MSVQDLDVALNATFSSASQKRLYELGAYNNAFGGDTLPTTVERYLQVLCDPTVYALQRRWVGLVLRKMVDTSKDTVRHLETLSHTLPQLGAVLLRNTELEETKIVVGILMREMISNGVDFDSFWLSEKIPNNVPYFPLEDGHTWMASFQSFLDTFDALKLMDSETDPVILYPIALSGSDGFKWRDPEPVHSVAIIQDNSLTIVAPDVAMRRFVFVDIPLDHIQSTHLQKSTLHDSQARTTEYNPWDIVLSLTSSTWTYRVNAAKNTGSELTILFANHRDAEECQGSIMEIKNTRKQSSLCKISSSEAVLDVGTVNKDTRGSKGQVLGNSASVGQAQDMLDTLMDESRGAVTERPTQEGHTNKPDEALLGVGSGSSEPPSNAITLVPETVDGGGNTIEEASISRSNGPQRKTRIGVLPKIKKFQRLVGVAKIEYGNHEDAGDEFTFPDESPRMIRPKKKPKRPPPLKTAAVTKSNAQTKPIPTASKTRANPKAEPIQEQVNDTVDDENSLSLKVAQDRSPRKLVPKTKTVARRAGKSPVSTHSRKSTGYGLRSTQKLNTPSCNTGLADPFAIPSDDAPMTRIPNKRKRTEDLDYNESEAVIPEAKRSRGANKQVQASQTMTKRNTKRRGGKSGVSNASTVKAKTRKHEQQMSLEKHTVLASLLSKPEQDQLPKSKLDSRTSVNDEHITKGSDRLTDGDGMLPQSHRTSSSVIDRTEMPSEADIISRLNCRTEEQDFQNATAHKITDGMKLHNDLDDDALNIWNEARSENNIARDPAVEPEEVLASLHEKHAAELNSPSTPRVNKLMKNVSGIGNDTSRANTLNPPTTFAPPRIMRDPSSPCADATRVRLEQTGSLNDQDISGLRTIEETPKTQSNAQKLKRKWTPSQELIIMAEVDGHPTWAHTPIHHPIVRTQSGGSVNIEVLSSNSKPLPAPPEAPSRAISGHAYSTDVELEMTVGEYEMAKSDPFAHPAKRHKGTDFIRRLTGESDHSSTREVHHQPSRVEIAVVSKMQSSTGRTPKVIQRSQQTSEANLSQGDEEDSIKTSERVNNDPATLHAAPMKQPRNRVSNASVKEQYISSGDPSPQNIEHTLLRERHNLRDEHVRMEGDTTLVAEEEQPSGPLKASPVHFRSSPPARRFSHSSHSSTSAEPEQLQESDIGPCILTEEAEDMEWQQSLQPHQRGIGEQLTRVSRRILQNIIDNEDAVKDIADTYATDGQTLLNSIYNRCDSRVQSIFTGIDTKKTTMKSVLSGVAKRLKEETDQVEDEPVQYALAKELANDSRNTRSE